MCISQKTCNSSDQYGASVKAEQTVGRFRDSYSEMAILQPSHSETLQNRLDRVQHFEQNFVAQCYTTGSQLDTQRTTAIDFPAYIKMWKVVTPVVTYNR